MTRYVSILFVTLFFLTGCSDTAHVQEPATPAVTFASFDVFGSEFDQADSVPVQQVAASPIDFLGEPVKVSGTITEVCQGRGCWMTLQVSDAQLVRIVMPRDEDNNYLFTLDKGMSGRRAIVQGTLDESTLAEFEAPMHQGGDAEDHHAGDEHAEEEMTTGLELHITASGVLVEKADESVESTD
ncbi:MAG: DUF4920 domain-containing protein [Bacteroidota bacterium]|nr:DUF4920 domain-containing protein [Bacteroidota bacterium]